MVETVFLNSESFAAFLCPDCGRSWNKDLSEYKDRKKQIVFNCKCPCGNSFPVRLERRRFPRRSTNLSGAFIHDKKKIRGVILIRNLSLGGIGFELSSDYLVSSGDVVLLRFNLDDALSSLISREAQIKKIDQKYIGAEFLDRVWKHDVLHLYLKE